MTSLSRRACLTAVSATALATVLTGCGGGFDQSDRAGPSGPREDGAAPDGTAPDSAGPYGTPRGTPPPSRPSPNAAHALARSVPVRLRIPAIEVDTPVMRLGLAANGSVNVPPITTHDQAGWYGHSPTPGQIGPSVILGHATVGAYGDGVFHDLARLRRGDRIEARLGNGTTARFTVETVRTVAKAEFPTEAVYGDVDRPELRLITCGGPRTGDGYRDNVIVFAGLSSATP